MPVVRAATADQSAVKAASGEDTIPTSVACLLVRNTSAVCSNALAGMHPRLRQVPPRPSASTSVTRRPADAP